MIVKDIMTRTSFKYFVSDYIEAAADSLLKSQMKGGLVYNLKDELVGCFSAHHLLTGIRDGKKTLSDIYQANDQLIDELSKINHISLTSEQELWPVQNKHYQVTGFLTKDQFLTAYAKISQVELGRLDAIFNSAHNGIISIDLKGRITSINPPAEKMALTTKEQALGSFLTDVVTPSGLLNVIRTGKGHTEKYKVGHRKYVTHRTPIYDANLQLVGAVGVFQDISEIEFISNELDSVKQILSELDTIINNTSDGICITDREGNILKCNNKFIELFNYNPKMPSKPPSMIKEMVIQVEAKGSQHNVMETSTDHYKPLIITANPIKNNDSSIERVVINAKDMTELDSLRNELDKTKSMLEHMHGMEKPNALVAQSSEMKRLIKTVEQVSKVDVTVLLTGESGVGKEVIAKIIQQLSPRAEQPFIKVNCGAIPDSLIESELFGYEGGAFTGALKKGKKGLFEQANNGTILLDEIADIPMQLQVRLLRVLQEMEIIRVGSASPKKINVRVIAATNQNLQDLVTEGRFREDLYYRLNVIPIYIPPLRKRAEDIPLIIDTYASMFAVKYSKQLKFTKEAIHVLTNNNWPGNVRELVNMMERIYVTATSMKVSEEDVRALLNHNNEQSTGCNQAITINEVLPLKAAVYELEKELISKVSQSEKSYRGIARVLEVNPSTIVRKVKKMKGGF